MKRQNCQPEKQQCPEESGHAGEAKLGSLIGLWILTTTVPRLAVDLYVLSYMPGADDYSPVRRSILYEFAEAVIALWLICGAKGFRKVFWWAQSAGTDKSI